MPHLVRWNADLKDFGLIIIAPHCQGGSADQVTAKAKSMGVAFTVTDGSTRVQGANISGIPHCIIFDHTGKCIFDGHPNDADRLIRPAVGKALVETVEKPPTSKALAPIAASLKKGDAPLSVLPKLVALQKSTDATTAEEAKMLLAKLTEVGQKKIDQAESVMKDDPLTAYQDLESVPGAYKGTPVATKATSMINELRKDKRVAAELRARPALDKIKKLEEQLKTLASKIQPTDPNFKRVAAAPLASLKTALTTMKKSYPDAKATQDALAIGERYGVAIK